MLHVELRDIIKERVQHQNKLYKSSIQIKLENPISILNDTN